MGVRRPGEVGGEDRKGPERRLRTDSFTVLSIAPNLYVQRLKQRFSKFRRHKNTKHTCLKCRFLNFTQKLEKYLSIKFRKKANNVGAPQYNVGNTQSLFFILLIKRCLTHNVQWMIQQCFYYKFPTANWFLQNAFLLLLQNSSIYSQLLVAIDQ